MRAQWALTAGSAPSAAGALLANRLRSRVRSSLPPLDKTRGLREVFAVVQAVAQHSVEWCSG